MLDRAAIAQAAAELRRAQITDAAAARIGQLEAALR
jgi:hypothetical protein